MACKREIRKDILQLMNNPIVTKLFETSVGEVHVIEVLSTLQSVAHRRLLKTASKAEIELKEKLKRTTRRLVAARKEWNDTRNKLAKSNGKLAEAAKELKKLGNDLKLSMETHERERQRDSACITSLLEQLTTATTKRESVEAVATEADRRLRCAVEEQLELKNEIRNLKKDLEEKDIRVYSEALEEAENKAKEYKRDKENLQSEVDRLNEEIEMANIIIDEWETEYNESEVELEIAKEEINELKARSEELQNELKVLRASERCQHVENFNKINGQRTETVPMEEMTETNVREETVRMSQMTETDVDELPQSEVPEDNRPMSQMTDTDVESIDWDKENHSQEKSPVSTVCPGGRVTRSQLPDTNIPESSLNYDVPDDLEYSIDLPILEGRITRSQLPDTSIPLTLGSERMLR